jgi:copper transport protein
VKARVAGALAALAASMVGAPAAAVPPVGAVPPVTHARLHASTPAADAILAQAPAEVVLTFNRNIAPPASVAVTAPSGTRVGAGEPAVAGKVVTAPIAAPEQGTYTVGYRAVSVDGHPITGSFTFSIGHRSTPYAAKKRQRAEETTDWVLPAAGGGLVALGVGFWSWRRIRSRGRSGSAAAE